MAGNEDCTDLLKWAASRGITDRPRATLSSSSSMVEGLGCSTSSQDALGCSLTIANFPHAGGRGLAATRSLKEGELILRVPKSALMSSWSAKGDPLLAKSIGLHPELSSTQILTVHLLNEVAKWKLSAWYPYLVHLPRVHHTLAHLDESQIHALQCSKEYDRIGSLMSWTSSINVLKLKVPLPCTCQVEDARWIAQKAVEKSVMEWEAAKIFMQEINLRRRFMSFKAWLWASATISSRTLHVPWDEAGTLCPVGDLFNYAPPGEYCLESRLIVDTPQTQMPESKPNNEGPRDDLLKPNTNGVSKGTDVDRVAHEGRGEETGDDESESDDDISCKGVTIRERLRDGGFEPDHMEYCFYARQDYQAGQQVLLCYGLYNNLELLEHYGFLLPHNPNDNVQITLPDSAEFGFYNDILPLNVGGVTCIETNGSPSFSLLAGVRLRAAHAALRKGKGHFALMGKQISLETDIQVYQWLTRKCELMLSCLPTTLEEDLILIKLVNSAQTFVSVEASGTSLSEILHRTTKAFKRELEELDSGQENVIHELESFMEACRVLNRGDNTLDESAAVNTEEFQLERWKLALEWRIGSKQILHNCLVFCAKKLRRLKQ